MDIHCRVDQCDEMKNILSSHNIDFYVGVDNLADIADLYPVKHSSGSDHSDMSAR